MDAVEFQQLAAGSRTYRRYGARPLRRAVTNEVEDLVAEESLEGKIKKGDRVTLDAADDKLVLTHKDAKAPAENENKDE